MGSQRALFLFTIHLKKMVSMSAENVRIFSKELLNLQSFAHPIRSLSSRLMICQS